MHPSIARVALPVPLDKYFDYLIPKDCFPVIGGRVSVPFGRQTLIGLVTELVSTSEMALTKLKPIHQVLDDDPVWPFQLYQLLKWCSQYYQYPLGETLSNALPVALRKGKAAEFPVLQEWSVTDAGREQLMLGLGRAVRQAKVLNFLSGRPASREELLAEDMSSQVLRDLQKKGWVTVCEKKTSRMPWPEYLENESEKPRLNEEQAVAVATVNSESGFGCYLLEGVTGSGKTEVYLNMIAPVLARKQQALVLVPEIGLTSQTIERFRSRFQVPVVVMHSGLNDTERLQAWLSARDGHAGVVIGTRSALFTPFQHLGIIIVDEEHDASYKQQDSLRYHARDVAVMRASLEGIPVILGSATPALETLQNALSGKYHHLRLTSRAGTAVPARNRVLDIKGLHLEGGLSAPLMAEMRKHLQAGNQVLLFLNRRGYAPVLMCHDCGWTAACQRCDMHYTYHQLTQDLRCHHCGSIRPVVNQCQNCGSQRMVTSGVGTEQLEHHLGQLFPEYKTIRIDRDSTRRKGTLESALESVRKGEYHILIGTQMLAKGHHFPDVTLVALLDVDSALFSNDFRAAERLAQLFTQVAGRAGRASKPGEVVLQTHHPEHNLLQVLLEKDYRHFAMMALEERRLCSLPPFNYLTLFKAESNDARQAEEFLRQVRHTLEANPVFDAYCSVIGPSPAPLAKRAGKYRWQLLLQVSRRTTMQQLLVSARPAIQLLPLTKRVRWSLDVEPHDLS
ncbi:primosomal protein N' [Vibrio quintilis]|uniref:primosomal protein N' n=1 Tax=Vibrio quintilis TaxID=1117707 RepID=UPI00093753EC|nr:primosomal protein N' [Vibrio quintilis]